MSARPAPVAPPFRYPLAAGALVAGALASAAAGAALGRQPHYLFYFPAVVLAGWYGGFGPGMLCTLGSAGAALAGSFLAGAGWGELQSDFLLSVLVFIGSGALISALNGNLHRAMRGLREASDRFERVVENAPYAMLLSDPQGRIRMANGRAERLFGYGRDELCRMSVDALVPERSRAAHAAYREGFNAAPAARPMGVGRHLSARRKDGVEVPVEIGLNHVETQDGPVVLASIIDITERLRAEAAIRESNESLEAAVAERTKELTVTIEDLRNFSSALSHDLRAPLRALQGYAHILQRREAGTLDRESAELLTRIGESAVRLDRLVQDLLAYNGLQREEVRLQPLDLDSLVAKVLERYEFPKAAIRVKGPLGSVLGAESLAAQVLANLLDNAAKFVPPGRDPEVDVWTEAHDGWVRLNVRDNGIGVPPESKERIFQPFERLHPPGAYTGTGIGLAIVRKGVERMGGVYGVESEPEHGSRFWVDLRRG